MKTQKNIMKHLEKIERSLITPSIPRKTVVVSALIYLSILCSSCGGSKKKYHASIDKVILDYVVYKRDGCRFSRVYFEGEIINSSRKDSIALHVQNLEDFCDFSTERLNIYLHTPKGDTLLLSGTNIKKDIIVLPNSSYDFEAVLQEEINYNTLMEFYSDYLFLEDSFSIVIKDLEDIMLVKNSECDIELRLDDSIISLFDTARLNRELPIRTMPEFTPEKPVLVEMPEEFL